MNDLNLLKKSLAVANVNVDVPVLELIFKVDELISEKQDSITLRDITDLVSVVASHYDNEGNLIVDEPIDEPENIIVHE